MLRRLATLHETDHLRLTTNSEPRLLTANERDVYRRYVCHVWAIMRRFDRHGLRHRVSEPAIGNPFPVRLGCKTITQDLATSVIECNLLADLHDCVPQPRVAELGAGYGRLAHVYAVTQPGLYCIFDIPPALAVAQWYLEQVLGRSHVLRFRHFDRIEEVLDQLSTVRVAFFTPNQLQLFPPRYFDTVLSISTLPEMRPDQVETFLGEFQRLARRHIFLKQWKRWRNPTDGTDLTADSYRLGPDWTVVIEREGPHHSRLLQSRLALCRRFGELY